jgi:Zn-dependent oligopeptidase
MMNTENKTLQTLKRENEKKMLELNNTLAMEEILLEKFKVISQTEQQLAIIKA